MIPGVEIPVHIKSWAVGSLNRPPSGFHSYGGFVMVVDGKVITFYVSRFDLYK